MRRILMLLAMVAVGMLVAGCNASGGGYIPSATDEGKATFGFRGKCENNEDGFGVFKGQLQYNDREADVKFHAVLGASLAPNSCESVESDPIRDQFDGRYRVSGGPKEAEGTVTLLVEDNGEPGINGDEVTIVLVGGRYDGYFNEGTVEGGNIQVH
jgi:hypothetical protein